MSGTGLDPLYLNEQYETLRREALAAQPLARRGHGLALFLCQGMTAWSRAVSALIPPPPRPPEPGLSAELAPGLRSDVVSIMADMVLSCSQEAT